MPVPVRAREFSFARRVRHSVPRQPAHLHTQAEPGAYLRDSSQVPRRRPFIYFKPPYAIGSIPSLSGYAIAHRWHSLPRVRRHRASKPPGSFQTGAALAGHHGPINIHLSFPTPTIGTKRACWKYSRSSSDFHSRESAVLDRRELRVDSFSPWLRDAQKV